MGSRFKKDTGQTDNTTDQSIASMQNVEPSFTDIEQSYIDKETSDITAELLISAMDQTNDGSKETDSNESKNSAEVLLDSLLIGEGVDKSQGQETEAENTGDVDALVADMLSAALIDSDKEQADASSEHAYEREQAFDSVQGHTYANEQDYMPEYGSSHGQEQELDYEYTYEQKNAQITQYEQPAEQEQAAPSIAEQEAQAERPVNTTSELPDAAANLSYEGIEQGRLIIEAKKRRIWPLFVTGIVIFILATAAITYVNRMLDANLAAENAQKDLATEAVLDESIALIQNADSVIVALDKASASVITENDIPRLESLIGQKGSILASLKNASGKAQEAKNRFISSEKVDLSQNAIDAAALREQMLEMSSSITEYDIAAMKTTLAVEYVFAMILDADSEMRQAVSAVNSGGSSAVSQSLEANKRALEKLVLAEQAIAVLDMTLLQVDLKSISDYLGAKKATAEIAVASDQAFIDGDYNTYRAKTDEFNAKDEEAVTLAANIPADARSLIYTAYEEKTAQLKLDYAEIRSRAAENDAHLRDYLGVTIEQAPASEQSAQQAGEASM